MERMLSKNKRRTFAIALIGGAAAGLASCGASTVQNAGGLTRPEGAVSKERGVVPPDLEDALDRLIGSAGYDDREQYLMDLELVASSGEMGFAEVKADLFALAEVRGFADYDERSFSAMVALRDLGEEVPYFLDVAERNVAEKPGVASNAILVAAMSAGAAYTGQVEEIVELGNNDVDLQNAAAYYHGVVHSWADFQRESDIADKVGRILYRASAGAHHGGAPGEDTTPVKSWGRDAAMNPFAVWSRDRLFDLSMQDPVSTAEEILAFDWVDALVIPSWISKEQQDHTREAIVRYLGLFVDQRCQAIIEEAFGY